MNSPEKFDKPITVMYLIDTCISPPDNPKAGGAEKQLYLLFASLASNIFKPIVVQLSPHKSLPVATGSIKSGKVFHLPTQKFYNLNGLRQLRCLFTIAKQSNVDIIHTFFEKSEVMGWLTGRFCGIPIWITS